MTGDSVLLRDLPKEQQVWMSHQDQVTEAPEGFLTVATSDGARVAAMEDRDRGLFGVQFHPEVAHTPRGDEILRRFLYDVCGASPSWTSHSIIETQVEAIRSQVGEARDLRPVRWRRLCGRRSPRPRSDRRTADLCLRRPRAATSRGGRAGRGDLRSHFEVDLIRVQAEDRFLELLAGVTDPEQKRRIIGETFIRVFEEAVGSIGDARFLVQGTLYPDVIESGSASAATIKTHHNVGGLPPTCSSSSSSPCGTSSKTR